jgi:hypothetical protein
MIEMRGEAIQNRDDISKVGLAKLGIYFSGFKDSVKSKCRMLTSFAVHTKSSGAVPYLLLPIKIPTVLL